MGIKAELEILNSALAVARASFRSFRYRGQGSMEYIMILSAVSIVIVIALAMITQLKGVALHTIGSSNSSIYSEISSELANLTNSTK
ncbi:MAG: hypothetical protein QXN59_02935 [Candidatus Micrarchaeaceae archaeon]